MAGEAAFRITLAGLPVSGTVVTVHADPVSRATDMVPIGEPSSSSPVGVASIPSILLRFDVSSRSPVAVRRTGGAVSMSRLRFAFPLPVRRALFGTLTTLLLAKPQVKRYFPSHRLLHRTFWVVPRSALFIHCSSTVHGEECTG